MENITVIYNDNGKNITSLIQEWINEKTSNLGCNSLCLNDIILPW